MNSYLWLALFAGALATFMLVVSFMHSPSGASIGVVIALIFYLALDWYRIGRGR